MTTKHTTINGFRAEVLSDERVGYMRNRQTTVGVGRQFQAPARLTAQALAELQQQAEASGFDQIVISRHVYAAYDLRCVMKRRSGTRITQTTYERNHAGVWVSSSSSSQSFY